MSAEKLLPLSGGRTLMYEYAGVFTSWTLVVFFSASLSVGSATHPSLSPVLISKGVMSRQPSLVLATHRRPLVAQHTPSQLQATSLR